MRLLTTLIGLAICTTSAFSQGSRGILPASFELSGAMTNDSLKTLVRQDSIGMYLTPLYRIVGLDNEMAIELTGYAKQTPGAFLTFTIGEIAYSDGAILRRIEMFNYTTSSWDLTLDTKTPGSIDKPARPYFAPVTALTVRAADYVDPETGEIKTRIAWRSSALFRTVWIDFANWSFEYQG